MHYLPRFKTLTLALLIMSAGCQGEQTKAKEKMEKTSSAKETKARIKTVHGDVVFRFFTDVAPVTSARIKELVKKNFYNGITFHRVIPGFVAQAGDPTGTGSGGSGQNLKAEFSQLNHKPGIIAMARKGNDINSADSQFYITLGTPSHLDGQYTIFGEVTEGLEIANKIKQGDKIILMTLE